MKSVVHKPLLLLPPELAHNIVIWNAKVFQNLGLSSLFKTQEAYKKINDVKILGLDFKNPIGLAAGFDKNAEITGLLSNLGFSFLEVGTLTPKPQKGNPKPRIFRIKKEQSIVNRLGFNNDGYQVASKNIIKSLKELKKNKVHLGINIGKNKDTNIDQANLDYQQGLEFFDNIADYFTINISSPNTQDLRSLQNIDFLSSLNHKSFTQKPVLVKLAPELQEKELAVLIESIDNLGFDGVILTNTLNVSANIDYANKFSSGGVSGLNLKSWSRKSLVTARKYTKLPIISVGGIHSSEEIKWRLDHGANLIQLYTSFIYGGPFFISDLLRGLEID